MYIEVTMVRLKDTKEPVLIVEHTDDIVHLGQLVDYVTSPSHCEYTDATLEVDLEMVCMGSFPKFASCEDEAGSAVSGFSMGVAMAESVLDLFQDEFLHWIDMPEGFDFMSTDIAIEGRYYSNGTSEAVF